MRILIFVCGFHFLSFGYSQERIQVPVQPAKRGVDELSYSYTATDIGSKGGTHIKTITVIKNIGHKKEKTHINPDDHKDENWGTIFRDNFDSYGEIPDVPEIKNIDFFLTENNKGGKGNDEDELGKPDNRDEIPIYEAPEERVETVAASDTPTQSKRAEHLEPMEESETAAQPEVEASAGEPTAPAVEGAADQQPEANNDEQESRRNNQSLPEDVELISPSPINLKQAELSARAQSLYFKKDVEPRQQQQQQQLRQSESSSRSKPQIRPKRPEVNYQRGVTIVEIPKRSSPLGKQRLVQVKKKKAEFKVEPLLKSAAYTTAPSNTQNTYVKPENYQLSAGGSFGAHSGFINNNNNPVVRPSLQTANGIPIPLPSTTVQTPYLAPRLKPQVVYQPPKSTFKVQTSSQKPYVAPSVTKNYKFKSSNSENPVKTTKPATQRNNYSFQKPLNSNTQRFRGIRYK